MSDRFKIKNLGKTNISSPIKLSLQEHDFKANYVKEGSKILYDIKVNSEDELCKEHNYLELAGPRENIYFDPSKVSAAIVTCGGLSPGLNNVIRSVYNTLHFQYGVKKIYGIKYGFWGLLPEKGFSAIEITPEMVEDIQSIGGTIFGSSRGGGERTSELVDSIERMNLNMVFILGGDGTQKGASKIANEILKRNLKISVIGIPKTIDNDLVFVDKTFGFDTAVEQAVNVINSAHVEAKGAYNGIGLVKLMGRHSGFIATHATLATTMVNYLLIPEIPFDLYGENGFLKELYERLKARKHAVIVVAEGAGQDLIQDAKKQETDASGNLKLKDIGLFLRQEIENYLNTLGLEHKILYFDPSYLIRSVPANSSDAIFCARLGQNAVHAAMAGKTDMVISMIHNQFVHVPISAVVSSRKQINPDSSIWRDVINATGQPLLFKNDAIKLK